MILHNNREMDARFVNRVIKEHKLNPVPIAGFHSRPHYWQETSRWRRVVEDYDWGAVLYVDDRERDLHGTAVAVGRIELAEGIVMRNGHTHKMPIGWYHELVEGIRREQKPSAITIPECLGFHQDDHICDGGINPVTKRAEPACHWRPRCTVLQAFVIEQGRYVEDLLRGKSPEQIVQITTRLIEKKHPAPAPTPTAVTIQPRVRGAKMQAESPEGTDLISAVRLAANEVAQAAGLVVAADKSVARVGDLFLIDRTANTDYISLYQATKAKPVPICSFRLRRRIGGFKVQLPLDKDSDLLKVIVESDIRPWKDGAFKVAVNDVIPGELRMQHIVNILAQLVRQ